MKFKKWTALLLVLCLMVGCLAGCNGVNKVNIYPYWLPTSDFPGGYVDDYEFVSYDNETALYIDPATFDIALVKDDGSMWESTYVTTLSTSSVDGNNSLFVLSVKSLDGSTYALDSWADCLTKEQFSYTNEDGVMSAVFTVGTLSYYDLVPEIIRADVFEKQVLKLLDEETAADLKKWYVHVDLSSGEYGTFSEGDVEAYLALYPLLADTNGFYVLDPAMDIPTATRTSLQQELLNAGYTMDELEEEYEAVGYLDESSVSDQPVFELTINFSLDNGDLVVEIPADQIYYDTSKYALVGVDLLRNLTSVDPTQVETSEIFLPDGTGAILDCTQSSYRFGKITRKVYGTSLSSDNIDGEAAVSLPVFSISRDDMALMGIVESGEAMAEITASYSGTVKCVYPTFDHQEYYTESNTDNWTYITTNNFGMDIPTCTYRMRYKLLTGGQTDYVSLATVYREYLQSTGAFGVLATDSLPLYVNTIGSVNVDDRVLLMPVNHEIAITTLEQDKEILQTLNDAGINSVYMKLSGVLNGGMMNTLSNKAKLTSTVGSKSELLELIEQAQSTGGNVYPDVSLLTLVKDSLFDGFSPVNDAARGLNEKYASYSTYNLATNMSIDDSFSYIVSPNLLPKLTTKFLKSANKLWASQQNSETGAYSGISLNDIGSLLPYNYADKNMVNRDNSQDYVVASLQMLSESNSLMVSGSNQYVLSYADHLLNLASESSGNTDLAATVPFLQIVLHGSINYSLEALNMASDNETMFLKSVETGAGLSVVLAAQNVSKLRSTAYSYYLSVDSEYWLPIAIDYYNRANAVIGDVVDQAIVNHGELAEDVYATVYEGGKTVIVNYNYEDVTVNGQVIASRDVAVAQWDAATTASLLESYEQEQIAQADQIEANKALGADAY